MTRREAYVAAANMMATIRESAAWVEDLAIVEAKDEDAVEIVVREYDTRADIAKDTPIMGFGFEEVTK